MDKKMESYLGMLGYGTDVPDTTSVAEKTHSIMQENEIKVITDNKYLKEYLDKTMPKFVAFLESKGIDVMESDDLAEELKNNL